MSLLSSLRKNKQEAAAEDSTFYSRAEEESKAVRRRSKRQDGKDKDNEPVDPVLPEKKRARRRLIGAVALVLAAVIGLPMIFDSEPKPVADDIAIQIPSKDKAPAATRPAASLSSKIAASASLDPREEVVENPAAAPADSKAQEADQSKPVAPLAAAAVPAAKAKEDAVKPVTEVRPEAKPEVKTEAKAEAKPESKPESKPEAKSADKKADDVRAKALLEGKPDPGKSADKKPGKFVIQVAALATKEKIDEVQGKLKSGGLKPYTEKVATQSGDRTRIRVGPFATQEEANKAKAKILKLGLNATLLPA